MCGATGRRVAGQASTREVRDLINMPFPVWQCGDLSLSLHVSCPTILPGHGDVSSLYPVTAMSPRPTPQLHKIRSTIACTYTAYIHDTAMHHHHIHTTSQHMTDHEYAYIHTGGVPFVSSATNMIWPILVRHVMRMVQITVHKRCGVEGISPNHNRIPPS